jgi:copper transport protein
VVQRAACLVVLVAASALLAPATAFAHANLVRTDPADRSVLERAPARVLVVLDDDVRVAPGNEAIRNGDGSILAGKPTTHGKTLVLPLRKALGKGDYSVRWSVVSDDGHIVQGALAFAIGLGRAPPVSALRPTNEVSVGTLISRWLFFAGLLVASGLALFDLLVWRHLGHGGLGTGWIAIGLGRAPPVSALRPTNEVRFGTAVSRWLFFAGLLVASGLALFDVVVWRPLGQGGLGTGWIAIGLAAMFVSAHGLVHASHGGSATRFGLSIDVASAVAATGAAAAAIAIADRSAAPFALVLAVALLPVPTVAGHALDAGRSWIEVPIDFLHVLAAAVWIGGLFALGLVVPRAGAPAELFAAAARRFSRLALASVIVIAATGIGRALAELSAVTQLWTTGYGRVILIKTGLFAVLLGFGSVSRTRVLAGVERLRTLVLAELFLVLGVVVAVGLLTSLHPGRR